MPEGRKGPYQLYEVLEKEYEELHGPLPAGYPEGSKDADVRLKAIIDLIHALEEPRAALCFSGGGIRSATFGLGILQGLARHGLLTEFDYLSTVSGGGYLGGWFSAWLRRERRTEQTDRDTVVKIQDALRTPPAPKLQPEPEPVRHLRSYSNYMSPRLGLLSADTWTLVAIYFRNLFLNWLVLVPLIMGVLALPRFALAVASWGSFARIGPGMLHATFWVAVLFGVAAIAYIISNRPSLADCPKTGENVSRVPRDKRYEGWFLWFCMLPLAILACLITTYWAWVRIPSGELSFDVSFVFFLRRGVPNAIAFMLFGVLLYFAAYLVAQIALVRKPLLVEPLLAVVTGSIGGLLTYLVASSALFDTSVFSGVAGARPGASQIAAAALYICFAAPAFLMMFLIASTIFVGLASFYMNDADREWLARAGAWILIATVGWSVVSTIVIFGPVALTYLGPKLLTAIGSAAGIITIGGAASPATAANKKEEVREGTSGWTAFAKRIALALAAPVFAVFLLIVISLATTFLARTIHDAVYDAVASSTSDRVVRIKNSLGLAPMSWGELPKLTCGDLPALGCDDKAKAVDEYGLLNVIYYMPGWFFFVLMLAVVTVGVVMGFFVNINKFSLHGAYRDRLIRAYLGASRKRPKPATKKFKCPDEGDLSTRTPNPFTGFDENDNIAMSELVARPLHVVNITLNLVSLTSEQLAWQDRKAESFTVSRWHSGSFCVGYRKSDEYGRNEKLDRAISLGTAVAVSGAAASPNMGYYSSPAITFLLSLFNVRLGWWLGNPGKAGDDTFRNPGPSFGPQALVAETLGRTDDRHPYVYLSDGGHFENLGLYEMVLRRSHVIVISDGSADPSLTFNDLGNAISKVREDLGIPIVFDQIPITRKNRDKVNYDPPRKANEKYCAVGTICYKQKDGPAARNGVIIYIKPNIYGGEPADVFNYAKTNKAFPHESTGDQMYSESQFESYRMLGYHVVETMCKGGDVSDLMSFRDRVRAYLAPPDAQQGTMVSLPPCPP